MALYIEMVCTQMLGLLWDFLLSSYPFLLDMRIFLWRHEVGREPYCKVKNSFWMHHHVWVVVAKKKGNCEVWSCLNSFSRKHKNLAREMAYPVKHLVCQSDGLRWSLKSTAKAGYREPDVVAGICNWLPGFSCGEMGGEDQRVAWSLRLAMEYVVQQQKPERLCLKTKWPSLGACEHTHVCMHTHAHAHTHMPLKLIIVTGLHRRTWRWL